MAEDGDRAGTKVAMDTIREAMAAMEDMVSEVEEEVHALV